VIALAWLALAHGALDEQIELLNRRLAEAPDHARNRLRRGEMLRLRGEEHRDPRDWNLAEADFARALEIDPGLRDVLLARARLRLAAGRPAGALPDLDRYLEGEPGHAGALLWKARTLTALGRRDEAVAAYTRSLEAPTPPAPETFLERAELLEALGRRDDAVRSLDEGQARLGPLPALDARALDLEIAAGRLEAALARVDRRLAQAGRGDEGQLRRAELLARLGRTADARAACEKALSALASLPASRRGAPATQDVERRVLALQATLR
jgi:tetratricopeptide (TPR) repeat protein